MAYEYDVALSFAGEDRKFAQDLAIAMDDANHAVFYDEFEAVRLWGTDLSEVLGHIYGGASRYCILITSKHYIRKQWTTHERRFAIQNALQTRPDYIMAIRLDDTALPGWPSVMGYVDAAHYSFDDIVTLSLGKLGPPEASRPINVTAHDRDVALEILRGCFRRALFTRMASEIDLQAMIASLRSCT